MSDCRTEGHKIRLVAEKVFQNNLKQQTFECVNCKRKFVSYYHVELDGFQKPAGGDIHG